MSSFTYSAGSSDKNIELENLSSITDELCDLGQVMLPL